MKTWTSLCLFNIEEERDYDQISFPRKENLNISTSVRVLNNCLYLFDHFNPTHLGIVVKFDCHAASNFC